MLRVRVRVSVLELAITRSFRGAKVVDRISLPAN